jgi:hypothetical protein
VRSRTARRRRRRSRQGLALPHTATHSLKTHTGLTLTPSSLPIYQLKGEEDHAQGGKEGKKERGTRRRKQAYISR